MKRSRPRVLILGCGPAGLIAAHAAKREFNASLFILSVKRQSQLFGCQYLHAPIPGVSEEWDAEEVHYELIGDQEEYRKKVYGSRILPVSPQQLAGDHKAWDIRKAYQQLWSMYEFDVINMKLNREDMVPMLDHYDADVVVSSIPLTTLCQVGDRHFFDEVPCWAIGDSPEQRVDEIFGDVDPFTVICNGTKDASWYRISNVFGYSTVEWPGHRPKPPYEGVVPFKKPLSTDCDCLPSILRVGRYGKWQKGVLSHEAYDDTAKHLEKVLA